MKNNIELNSLSILTGSNASGKSTMLRSLGSACLLAMCGLRVPSSRLIIGNGGFSNIYIRSGTSDDPISGLSSHALEMSELASITNNCDKDSLLLLDEIGRGCPSASGASIAAATLEFLIRKNVKGLFATHWDEIFTLNSDKINNAQLFRMKNPLDDISEQFKLTEGKSKDKMAIQVAKISGIPDEIISNSYNFEKIIRASLDKNEITMNSNLKHRSFEHNNEKNLLDELTFLFNKMPIILRTENESMPPSMSKGSFLYVLLTDTNRIYVGESDNIDGRIKKHRKSPEKRNSIFFVFKMDNKSEARESESRTIKHLSKLGFFLISENDGNHYNF